MLTLQANAGPVQEIQASLLAVHLALQIVSSPGLPKAVLKEEVRIDKEESSPVSFHAMLRSEATIRGLASQSGSHGFRLYRCFHALLLQLLEKMVETIAFQIRENILPAYDPTLRRDKDAAGEGKQEKRSSVCFLPCCTATS